MIPHTVMIVIIFSCCCFLGLTTVLNEFAVAAALTANMKGEGDQKRGVGGAINCDVRSLKSPTTLLATH